MTAAQRVTARITREPASDLVDTPCWLWQGCIQRTGYGQIRSQALFGPDSQPRLTHVVVYEELVGPIPNGLEIDHLCAVKRCCNPAHLEPVTHLENVRRHYQRAAAA